LVIQIATDNGWGYTRVLGELKKLGIRNVSRSTVVNILTQAELDPRPKRGRELGTSSSSDTPQCSGLAISSTVFNQYGSRRVPFR
jgi:hypothetical protein